MPHWIEDGHRLAYRIRVMPAGRPHSQPWADSALVLDCPGPERCQCQEEIRSGRVICALQDEMSAWGGPDFIESRLGEREAGATHELPLDIKWAYIGEDEERGIVWAPR